MRFRTFIHATGSRLANFTPLVAIALTVLLGVTAIGWLAIRILSAADPSQSHPRRSNLKSVPGRLKLL